MKRMNIDLTNDQKRYMMIAGIVAGSVALLAYPAMLLFRKWNSRRQERGAGEDTNVKSFAPSYRGNHKPHHRKAETNGHLQHASA